MLVLGGGSEIAVACIAELARRGTTTRVHLAARDPERAERTISVAAPEVAVSSSRWDALDPEGHTSMVAAATDALGEIDLVISAVGVLGHHAGLGMAPGEVDAMVRANFAGPAAALSVVAEKLSEQGHGTIVVLSSVAAVRPRRSNFAYGSSKAGLDAFAQGLGDALVSSGVHVLVVRPGFVTSKMTTGLQPAPLATDPATVARAVADSLGGRRQIVSVPRVLGPAFAVLRNVPRGAWRMIAGDR